MVGMENGRLYDGAFSRRWEQACAAAMSACMHGWIIVVAQAVDLIYPAGWIQGILSLSYEDGKIKAKSHNKQIRSDRG